MMAPGAAIAAFVPAWLTAAGPQVFPVVAPLSPPYSYLGPGVAGFMVAGLACLAYRYARHPQRVLEVDLVHLDAEPAAGTATAVSREPS